MSGRIALMAAAALIGLATTAAPARADWLLTPYLGVSFGGDTSGQHITYGGSIGWMGAGVIGFEVDAAFAPDLFDEDDGLDLAIEDSNATTLMGNLIVGAPLGAVRPYVSGGAGLIRASVSDAEDFFDIDDNSFGVNIGGGVMGFVRENFGLRGDVRYFRSLQDDDDSDDIDLDFGSFDFWRATVGATFRF
jgi:opacity protein-like surface antigen